MCMKKKRNLSDYAITDEKAWKLSKEWKRAAIIWQTLDHVFTIGSFAASVGTIYIVAETDASHFLIILLSSISAILTLMSFACNPTKYKTNYRAAFQILNDALVENTHTDGRIQTDKNRKAVINAIKQAERYIGNTYDTTLDDSNEYLKGGNDEEVSS